MQNYSFPSCHVFLSTLEPVHPPGEAVDAIGAGFASEPALAVVMCGAGGEGRNIFSLHLCELLRGPPTAEY